MFSRASFSSTTARLTSSSMLFEPIVLTSRFISWQRKSSFFPGEGSRSIIWAKDSICARKPGKFLVNRIFHQRGSDLRKYPPFVDRVPHHLPEFGAELGPNRPVDLGNVPLTMATELETRASWASMSRRVASPSVRRDGLVIREAGFEVRQDPGPKRLVIHIPIEGDDSFESYDEIETQGFLDVASLGDLARTVRPPWRPRCPELASTGASKSRHEENLDLPVHYPSGR